MQRDFFQSCGGVAVGNLGLSVKYFIAGNFCLPHLLCFAYCNSESFWALCFLESQLKPHSIFHLRRFPQSCPSQDIQTWQKGETWPGHWCTRVLCLQLPCLCEHGAWDSWDSASVKLCWLASLALLGTISINLLMESHELWDPGAEWSLWHVCHWKSKIESREKYFFVCVGTANTWELLFALVSAALLLIVSRSKLLLKYSQHARVGHCWTEIFVSS